MNVIIGIMKSVLLLALITVMASCQLKNTSDGTCEGYAHRTNRGLEIDELVSKEVDQYYFDLLDTFNTNPLNRGEYDGYHLQQYSSHGFGKSIKFIKENSEYSLSVRCKIKHDWNTGCKTYKIKINQSEWDFLEDLIYEYYFWSADNIRANKALDPTVFFLHGNRSKEIDCKYGMNKLVARASPRYDRIGDLCYQIMEYENELMSRYESLNIIK